MYLYGADFSVRRAGTRYALEKPTAFVGEPAAETLDAELPTRASGAPSAAVAGVLELFDGASRRAPAATTVAKPNASRILTSPPLTLGIVNTPPVKDK
jgi:hypothetical protein